MAIAPLTTFLGMNNRVPRDKLGMKEGTFVADAVNVDFRANGKVSTRKGHSRFVVGSDVHSFNGEYFVDGTELHRLTGGVDTPATEVVLSGITPGLRMSYTVHAGTTLCSNGREIWELSEASAALFGIVPPAALPSVSVTTGGALVEGFYQFGVCYVNSSGNRSGAILTEAIYTAAQGAFSLTGIPQQGGYDTELYVTAANGTELFRHGVVGSSASITVVGNTDISLPTELMTRLPAGGIIRSFNGRVLTAAQNILFFTEPWSTLHQPATGFIPFPEQITMVEPCGANGVFISADVTYWLSGTLTSENTSLKQVLPYKAVSGTSGKIPNEQTVYWMSERGAVLGAPDGSVKNIQEAVVAVRPTLHGAAVVREEDGLKQFIASTFTPRDSVMATSTFMDAEVIHKSAVV